MNVNLFDFFFLLRTYSHFFLTSCADFNFFFSTGGVDEIVSTLRAMSVIPIDSSVSVKLDDILKRVVDSSKSNGSAYERMDLTAIFEALLPNPNLDATVREQIYRTIAEITRIAGQRIFFTNETIIKLLLERLSLETQPQQKSSSEATVKTTFTTNQTLTDTQLLATIQLCRALGNICYNNEDARNIIVKLNGIETIINLLDIKLDVTNELDVSVIKFRGGLLSNYLLGENHLSEQAIKAGILSKIEQILDNHQSCMNEQQQRNDEILLNLIQPLSLILDSVADVRYSPKLIGHLASILTISKDPDVADICLEILNDQAENGIGI